MSETRLYENRPYDKWQFPVTAETFRGGAIFEKMEAGAGFKPASTAFPREDEEWNRIGRDCISPATGKW
jgi:hypothetical protein